MNAQGAVHRHGGNVDTNVIIPVHYLNTSSHRGLTQHYMVDIDTDFVNRVKPRDIVVANENFGCGSSRERAPITIKASGISYVVASTFARIFYHSSINIGLPILGCEEVAREVQAGDGVSVDFDTGVIRNLTTGKTYQAQPFSPFI